MVAERGNALFLILLGITLFGALTMAVTNAFQKGNTSLSSTRIDALASDIIMTGAGLEKVIGKLLAKGNSESRISFNRSVGDGYELTPASDEAEKVFHISGGGAQYLGPAKGVLDLYWGAEADYGLWVYTSDFNFPDIGNNDADLVAMLPFIRDDICLAINKKFGISTVPFVPDLSWAGGIFKYQGTFTATPTTLDDGGGLISGKKAACIESSEGANVFYYVLHVR